MRSPRLIWEQYSDESPVAAISLPLRPYFNRTRVPTFHQP